MAINTGTLNSKAINGTAGTITAFTSVNTSFGSEYTRNAANVSRSALSYRFDWQPILNQAWTLPLPLVVKQGITYALPLRVNADFKSSYGDKVNVGFGVTYSLMERVNVPFEVPYDLGLDRINAPFVVAYAIKVANSFAVTYDFPVRVQAPFAISSPLVETINAPFAATYDLQALNPVSKAFVTVYNLEGNATVDLTDAITLIHAGDQIGIEQGRVEQDEGSFNWRGQVALADIRDYGRFQFNDDVTVTLYGEVYNMIVSAKQLSRGNSITGPTADAQLELLGVAARYDTPIAVPVNKTWGAITAKAAVEELLGVTVTWNIIDWLIPANRLSGTDASPVKLATDIVLAAGGVLEANPDGTISVRKLYPVSVPDYLTGTVDHTYTEEDDILGLNEGLRNQQVFNQFRIRDGQAAGFQDRVEFTADDDTGLAGDLRVYPSPFRSVRMSTTGPNTISLTKASPHEVVLPQTEDIQIIDGSATLRYPIDNITSVVWIADNLGALVFETGATTVTATAIGTDPLTRYSYATVSYNTRALHWRGRSPAPIGVQFLVIDDAA
jgi:hypothetical protein